MKKLALSFVAVLFVVSSYAQFTLGPRIGVSQNWLKVDETINNIQYESGDPSFGIHAGLFLRGEIGSFYIQPEALFSSFSGEIKVNNAGSTVDQIQKYNFNRFDVPVNLGLKFGAFRINAGPIASLNVSTKNKSSDAIADDIRDSYKFASVGYQAGIGLDLGNMLFDLKYEGGLTALNDEIQSAGVNYGFDQRINKLILSFGIKLF